MSSLRPERAAPLREPSRGRLETVALWIQVIGLPLALAGLLFAGLAYSRQLGDAQQALAAIQVQQDAIQIQQQEVHEQQRTIATQVQQLEAAELSAKTQEDLFISIRQLITVEKQLAALLAKGGGTP